MDLISPLIIGMSKKIGYPISDPDPVNLDSELISKSWNRLQPGLELGPESLKPELDPLPGYTL